MEQKSKYRTAEEVESWEYLWRTIKLLIKKEDYEKETESIYINNYFDNIVSTNYYLCYIF